MRGKGAVLQEALPTCGSHIERYRHHDTVPRRRPVRVGEGASAAGAEEVVRTCGSYYTDTAPRRPTPVSASTALGIKGARGGRGLKNKRDEEVNRGGVPSDGFEESVARCGFRNPRLVRPERDTTQMGPAASCIPGGVRGQRDTHDYGGTSSRPRAAEFHHVPTADLPAEIYDTETGSIEGPSGSFTVNNVQLKFDGYVLQHTDSSLEGPNSKALSVGNELKCKDSFVLPDIYGTSSWPRAEFHNPTADLPAEAGSKSTVLLANATSHLHNQELASINDSPKFQHEVHSTVVKAIYTGSEFTATASGDEDFGLVLESTHFYAEQGGQDPETRKPRVNICSDKETGRDADKKKLGTTGEEVKQLAQRTKDIREANNNTSTSASTNRSTIQILVKFCGATIPIQENLNMLSANMLIEHVCRCVGVRPTNLYSTFRGRILEPNEVLSYYQLQKDSTVYINPRLRGGSAGQKNWDAVIITLNLYHGVALPWDLLLPYQIMHRPMKVWYLDHPLQVRCQKVLIYLGRKHYVGICFGGFTSKQILFDADGNVHIDAAPHEYSQDLALSDYGAVSGIFDDALGNGINEYPTYFDHLINFLSDNGPVVDCRSKAVIAFVTNHASLLTHSRRIQITAVLDMLLTRLSEDNSEALIAILENFCWGSRLEQVRAMNHTYYFRWWYDTDGTIRTPYEENGVSLLRFSNNFFKHQTGFPLDQRDAAFALATKHKNYLPQLLCSILITFNDPNKPRPPSVRAFINEVIEMLGDHTVDCEIVPAN